MKKQFVTYDIAVDLKELGFDKECFGYFIIENKELIPENWSQHPNKSTWTINAPLWQQAFDWFREEHGIEVQQLTTGGYNDIPKSYSFNVPNCYIPTNNGFIVKSHNPYIAKKEILKKIIDTLKQIKK
jgi:hypothetical protein